MRVAELTGALLDYWVARAEHLWCNGEHLGIIKGSPKEMLQARWFVRCRIDNEFYDFAPSSRWDQGGPILEREGIDLEYHDETALDGRHVWWEAYYREGDSCRCDLGETPLIAAMRAFVARQLGDSVPDDYGVTAFTAAS